MTNTKFFDPKFFDEMAKRLADLLPDNVKTMRNDMEKHFRATLATMFGKLDLVTREEFDVQAMVLSKTRAKLEKLEHQVAELEKHLKLKKSSKQDKSHKSEETE